jgi:hypothetical protein
MTSACALPVEQQQDLSALTPADRALTQVELGLAAFSSNKYFEAESYFRKALTYSSSANNIRYNLALTLIRSEQIEEAENILIGLIQESENSLYLTTLAELKLKKFDHLEALKIYIELLNSAEQLQNRKNIALYARNISQILFTLGEEEDALCYSQRSVEAGGIEEEASHAAILMAFNYPEQIVNNAPVLEKARQRRDKALVLWYALANYDLGKYAEAHFLTKILEAEAISGGLQSGVGEFIELVNYKLAIELRNYKLASANQSYTAKNFQPNDLMRNYWPASVLLDLSHQVN